MVNIGNDWDDLLKSTFESESYQQLRRFLITEYRTQTIYPDMYDIFNALRYTSFSDTRVVIIGQDPYHGAGQAHGLCFSVREGITPPPSLVNIFKEQLSDLGIDNTNCGGTLTSWAKEGVLMLNAVLTVREAQPNSHRGKGWEQVTDKIISLLNDREQPLVFLLWGGNARAKQALITNPSHLVLTCAHPSPLSAYNGFFGCRHFSKANEFLKQTGSQPINWQLPKRSGSL
ncbi:MAG: uracil-DNA glycosylase [Ruminococcus sp.]|nr:uracil-DNA glycosylase [Ruminococcus sp.]